MRVVLTTAELHYLALKQLNLEAELARTAGAIKLTTPHYFIEEGSTTQFHNGLVTSISSLEDI